MDRTRRVRVRAWGLCAVAVLLFLAAGVLRATADDPWTALGLAGSLAVPVVGALIATRLPENPLGWLWCAFGLTDAVLVLVGELRSLAPAAVPLAVVERSSFLTLLVLLPLVVVLFPTGRLPSPAWRWLFRGVGLSLAVAVVGSLFATIPEDPAAAGLLSPGGEAGRRWYTVFVAGLSGLFLGCVLAMASLVVRLRRAGPVERRQLAWFAYAGLVNAAALLAALTGVVGEAGWLLFEVTFTLFPVAVGVAVLRYRLYEIDRIVSRTVSYAVLTAGLLLLYVVAVTALRPLLAPLAGTSELAVAVSTLTVAAAFRPARRRVQVAVDRRFDRTRYDGARAVDAYARRLRTEVDLRQVTEGLRDTVVTTVHPASVGVWLRGGGGPP
ncbi:hypothetical protein [Geodermatophilus sp. SYSU D00766]